ncbi:hypothetical protein B5S28_g2869 [[Candida] boidinii]|nr:hypothetical protein B5S28_g2869 [[Candida] boidinii]OWB62851.1 hypothetical protein B5S29_g3798 [[Candida] boidinii]OWB73813.1 hypothetical protein B5S31_g3576 [[Candida] boidinii]
MSLSDEVTDAEMKQFLDENEYLKNLFEDEKQLEIDSNLLNSSAEHHWLLKDYYLNSPINLPSRNLNIIILILDPFKSNTDLQKSLDLLLNKINENLDSFYKYYPWITDPPCFKIHDHEGTIYINGFLRIHNSVHNSPFTNEIWMMVSLLNNIFKDEKELYPDIYYKMTRGSEDVISLEMAPIYMQLPYFPNVLEPVFINRCWIRQGSIWFIPLDKDQRKIYDLIDSLNFIKNYPFKLYYDLELNESFHKILDIFPEKTINSTIYLKYKLPNNNNNLLKFIINNSYNKFSFLNKQINNYITYQILNKKSISKDLLIKNFENLSKLIDNENTDISIDNNKNLIELDLITNLPTFLQIIKFLTNSNDLINQESPDYTNITETDKFKIDLGNLILKSIDFNIGNSQILDIKKQKLEMSVEDYNNHISSFPLNKKQGFKERYNLEKAIDEYDLSMIFLGYEPVIPEKGFEMTEQDAGNLAEKLTQQLNELNINNKDIPKSNTNVNKKTVNKNKYKNGKSNDFSSAFAKNLASGFGGLDFDESNPKKDTKKRAKDDDEKLQEEEKKRTEQTKRHMDELDALNEKYIDDLHTSNGYYDSDGSYSSDGEEERIRNTIAEDEFFEFFCSEALNLSPEQIETFLATRERNI